jgi:biotin transport system substrate-specific component
MASATTIPNTLLALFQTRTRATGLVSNIAIVLFGTLFLAICAKIQVPVWPVPVTLQGFAVAVIAAAFGLRIGVATVALYLAEGAAGLPVFATGGGVAYFAGPTGGFLIGFLAMAAIIGHAADRGASGRPLALIGAMLVGNTALLLFGFVWLVALAGSAKWIDQDNVVASAFAGAIQPFVLWDALKMALAGLTVAGLWQRASR